MLCNPGSSSFSDLWWCEREREEGAPEMSIEIVSVRGKACLISAHLDFMTALRSAPPDREHYSCILS